MTMNGPLLPGTWCCVTAVSRESSQCSLFDFCALLFRRMCQECFHLPLSVCFCYCLLRILTGSLQTSWRGSGAVCVGAGPPVPLVSPAAFSCSPESPRLVLGQVLEGRFPFWTLELCPGGGTQPPGQPLRFLARNWMPWSLGSAAPGARAIVACVGTRWHAAAA